MKKLFVIGIGTGNPEHISMQGISALNQTDVVFIPTKGEDKGRLAAVRTEICDRYISRAYKMVEYAVTPRDAATADYTQRVLDWHDLIAASYAEMFSKAGKDDTGALLVWGDPGLYDSTLRILDAVRSRGMDFEVKVIPGITAIQALTAAFAIPLNTIGKPVTITTGRQLARGWPEEADSVVVMLDGKTTYEILDPAGLHIYWAAYVGMDIEIFIEGPLGEVRDEITAARNAARARNGWIMDIYLFRKS